MILIIKHLRTLRYYGMETRDMRCALGGSPVGAKRAEGDQKTPEGQYYICIKKIGKYGPSLGLSYPNLSDADTARTEGRIDAAAFTAIRDRLANGLRPPWGTPMGGEIYLHGFGTDKDWTAGCVALSNADAAWLYERVEIGELVEIMP